MTNFDFVIYYGIIPIGMIGIKVRYFFKHIGSIELNKKEFNFIVRLSTRARYSIRLMVYLADYAKQDKPIGLKEIAKKQHLSMRYLEQLVVPLKNANLIKSVAGKYGGYFLARFPQAISIGEIVEASIGPIQLMDCLAPGYSCQFRDICTSRRMWGLINTRITDVLYDYSLDDLSEKKMMALLPNNMGNETDEQFTCEI